MICIGDIRLDLETLVATVDGGALDLTVQEFDLLVLLARDAGKPVTQARLAAGLWQTPKPQHKRHLSVLIARLRAKLAGSSTHRLETMRKRGYGLMTPQANRAQEIRCAEDGLDVFAIVS